ncbi:MAG: ParB/Srx family N-terminal domain-containing protein, partial [Beijerinckiaceae bacterium]|nr:ParB/Srx family N-terminal domain-containing protein [Beijerinckiaceae bacterium]
MIEARHCTLSRLNVRKVPSEPALLFQLMADIEARGVLQNLIGVPVPKKSGKYEVIAGGRRLTAVKQLIADGKLPANASVPMLVMDGRDQAAEVSLAENLQREAMNPADACLAFRHCVEVEGAAVEDVARRFGVTTRFIEGRLRLGQLAP